MCVLCLPSLDRKARTIHEKKILTIRDSWIAHVTYSLTSARYLSFMTSTGLRHVHLPDFLQRRPDGDGQISQVLPWLFIGQFESANNLDLLLKHKITHILNVSGELSNSFPAQFVYMQCRIKDSTDQNAAKFFKPTTEFIERAENVKGKVRTVAG